MGCVATPSACLDGPERVKRNLAWRARYWWSTKNTFVMKLLFAVIVLTWKVSSITASCPDGLEPSFCYRNSFIPQLYCHGVELQSQWVCDKRSKGSCVCPAPLHRKRDGTCVPKDRCEDVTVEVENRPQEPPPKSTDSPYEIPDDLQGSKEDFANLQKFIKSNQTIYLLTVDSTKWPYALHGYCICLKSAFISDTASGALRTVDCYKDVQLMEAHYSVMMKQGEADFEAHSEYGRLKVVLKIHDNGTSHSTSNEVELQETFIVLDVTENCLLLQYGSWRQELQCMMWVFDIGQIKNTRCYSNMLNNCRKDIKDVCGVVGSKRGSDAEGSTSDYPNDVTKDNRRVKEFARQTTSTSVLGFLQSTQAIHLQMMSLDDWMNTDCECVMSELLHNNPDGLTRTLQCYINAKILIASERQNTIPMEKIITIEETVKFQITRSGGMRSVALKTMSEDAPSDDPSKQFPHKYLVLAAQSNCLLLSYGQSNNGGRNCLLWGLSSQGVNTSTVCYKVLESLCGKNTYDITETENPCHLYDVYE
ncbi:uncharacterized protein LOC125945697 [Dermacentor silvarum]|uniref:uncharacterized protein LOC125945697 n=1 Tax=Dermacentor silvarum TaxID=543639 RepID=UPI002101B471|nr:uncharacterized protein LOC125945697 [Dermacentor silvarum]